ncbi:unnamed protein product [Closterium sp. NIES-64]|nr:unnamed protein product [Closterium sp. NIES-64]
MAPPCPGPAALRCSPPAALHCGLAAPHCGPAALRCGPAALRCGPAALRCGPAALRCGPAALRCGPAALLYGPAALLCGPAASLAATPAAYLAAPPPFAAAPPPPLVAAPPPLSLRPRRPSRCGPAAYLAAPPPLASAPPPLPLRPRHLPRGPAALPAALPPYQRPYRPTSPSRPFRPSSPSRPSRPSRRGRAIDFEVRVDDLQLFLQCDRADGLSLFDLTSGASPAPAADADATVRSHWATRDAAVRLAVHRHLPTSKRAHFSQYRSAQTLGVPPPAYCPLLPLLLRPTSLVLSRSVRRLPLAGDPALARARGAGALEGQAGAVEVEVEAAGGVGVEVGVVVGVEVSVAAVEAEAATAVAVGAEVAEVAAVEEAAEAAVEAEAAEVAEAAGVAVELVAGLRRGVAPVVVRASSSSAVVRPCPLSSSVSGTLHASGVGVLVRAPTSCAPATMRFSEATQIPRWGELSRAGVAIYDLDFDAILSAMYAVSISDEGDCYRCFPPNPGIETAALGTGEAAALGTTSASASLTFTLDSGASRSFFRDRTTLTPLSRPVAVSLADPSGGPVLSHFSTVLPCPAAPSGTVSGLYLPSFSTNLVSSADLQDGGVHQFTPAHQRVTHYTEASTGRHLATFTPSAGVEPRAAPHSSQFPPTEAPLQTLHMDVWGPARVRGQGHERYFLLVVNDYSRYTAVFPLSSTGDVTEDVTFDEPVPYYRLFPYRTPSLPPPPLFLVPGPPPVDPLPPQGPSPSGVSHVDAVEPVEVTGDSGAAEGAATGGAEPGGAEPGGAAPGVLSLGVLSLGVLRLGVLSLGVLSLGVLSLGVLSLGVLSLELREWFARRWRRAAGVGGSSATEGAAVAVPGGARTGSTRAAGPAGSTGAGAAEGVGAETTAPGPPASTPGTAGGSSASGVTAGAGAPTGSAGAVPAVSGVAARPRPYFVPLLQQVLGLPPSTSPPPSLECPQPVPSQLQLQPTSPLPAPSPYTGPTGGLAKRREPASRPASPVRAARASGRGSRQRPPPVRGTHRIPTVTRLLATVVTDPSFESTAASALVAELVDFAARCRLDYAASLVAESESVCPPSVGGECALGTDVLEDRQEEFQCLAVASPHLASVLLTPEGDPDALDIPTPRSYAEAIEGPYSSQWQAAMDAEMASWKSTGTYVDGVPPLGANIVSGMWIFRVKRPLGSPPVFKARYMARGFSHRQGVDYFQTFSPTPKMTTLRVLLHVAAHRDYELHSLDFSTAFLQGSLHEEIRLRRPPGFTSTSGMGRSLVVLTGHADASWADDQATQRSSQGYTFSLGSGSVSWRATRSSSVLGSSCEAEIYAGAMAAQELRWLTYLLTDLGESPRSPPVLYVDNKAMLALCREERLEHRTKHIALRYFLARELQQRGQLRLAYVASEANTADVFTKALAPCDHQRFCTQLGLVPVLPHLLTS